MEPKPDDKVNSGQVIERKVYSLVICYDPATETYDVQGLQNPPWVVLGMLVYCESLVRRRDAENAMRDAQRVALARPFERRPM